MAIDIAKFIGRFVEEAREHLARLDQGIATLGTSPQGASGGDIDALFRSAHTIKGSARMLRLAPITDTAHALEDALGALRGGRLALDDRLSGLLQRAVDHMAKAVERLAQQPDPAQLPPKDDALCAALSALAGGDDAAAPPQPQDPAPTAARTTAAGLAGSDSVRVRLADLDALIHLMGEVIAHHERLRGRAEQARQLARHAGGAAAGELGPACESLALALRDDLATGAPLMRELHDRALGLRMLPLSMLFDPAARHLRELARSLGKEAGCRVEGADIALDRQAIDQLAEPIMHLLRNAVDHGLEPPRERTAAGKPARGSVRLAAREDGGWVEIEIADDGRGIDVAQARDKAVRKGLLSAEQAAAASDSEIVDLIFTPGFSTSALITDISGRGVGMDVVKATVLDQLQGSIRVHNRPGQGVVFRLRVPVSLAMMRVLLIDAGAETLGFLAQHVTEILRVPRASLLEVADRRALILRNELVPVMPLAELLDPRQTPAPPETATEQCLVVVLRVDRAKLALEIDALRDERDLVVKPVPKHLRHLKLVSGFVASGTNAVISVLHAPALLELAGRARGESVREQGRTRDQAGEVRHRLLVVDDSLNTREIEKDVLEAQGYRVTLAEDGIDGLHKAMKEPFDAVLTDVEMPRMDGFTLTERLRALDSYQARPIIIVTSREKEEDRQRGLRVGADAYIVKGDFDQNNLVNTLRALLD